tara:strand:+ start:17 stop:457 length:441 start_codon:yes stop_codon:yes gene_type:complete
MRLFVSLFAVLLLFAESSNAQESRIALVKVLEGSAFTVQGGKREEVKVGQEIYRQDVVETASGTVGLTFRDGSRISIGPNSRIVFKEFQYSPNEGKLSFLINIVKGTMHYISGIIAKLAPNSVKIETPAATVAVRGTRLLIKVGDD